MSLQTALMICGVVVLALISWFSFEKHRLQRINERARSLHGAGVDEGFELSGDGVDPETGEPVGRYPDGRPGGRGLGSVLRRHDENVKTIGSDPASSPDASSIVDGIADSASPDPVLEAPDSTSEVGEVGHELARGLSMDSADEVVDADAGNIAPSLYPKTGSLDANGESINGESIKDKVSEDVTTASSEAVVDAPAASPDDVDSATVEQPPSIESQYEDFQKQQGKVTSDSADMSPAMRSELDDAEQITQQRITPAFRMEEVDTDNEIDFIGHLLDFPKPIARDRALALYRQVEYLLEKPHRIIGLSHPHRTWVDLEEEPETGQYTELVLTLQLANQDGAINDSQLNKFSDLTVQICEAAGGRFQFSTSFEQATERAKQLDEFCKRYDVLAVLNVVAKSEGVFTGEVIEQFARDHDMHLGKMKIYHRDNDGAVGGQHLFSLANLYRPGTFDAEDMRRFSTSGLTIFMNVPTTTDPGRVFREMARVGRSLRDRFDANLVDQNKQTLTDQGIQNIQAEVDRLASQMRKEGITAGSESAVRLF